MSIVELRQYTLRPGARDTLIELFEREFVTGQQAVGIHVGGRFRDLDDPDRFVWLRSFPDMRRRRRSLEAFYTGPVWRAHRDAANATMVDSDDVLLLRGPGFTPSPGTREVGATICQPPDAAAFAAYAARHLGPDPLPASVDLAAYRVIQEALTNVRKHAGPGARAEVSVVRVGPNTEITVIDNGTGTGAADGDGGGHGLLGMRERVTALGGSCTAGPRYGGGFRVQAILPVKAAETGATGEGTS
ncbi:ATP-binding protein [Streptomyces hundungensis]|uniref:ATP-binding protein n=1 Tax=Streptomyces hundungensis TaxID=1077946 RepID=UPI003F53E6DA